jgi:tetratricopeptide (TPR) repeat protein
MTHLAAGQMLERQGDLQGAIEQYEKAVASNPRFTTAYNRLGIVYQKLGKLDDAVNILRQGIKADPDAAILHNNLAYCFLIQNRLVEAESECRAALRTDRNFKRARMNLAITLARSNRLQESLSEFSQVVPADVAHYNVGVIRLGEQDYIAAEKAFFEALALNPNCPGAKAYLDRTRRLASESANGIRLTPPPPDVPLAGQLGDNAATPP